MVLNSGRGETPPVFGRTNTVLEFIHQYVSMYVCVEKSEIMEIFSKFLEKRTWEHILLYKFHILLISA